MSAAITWVVTQLDCLPQADGQTDVVVTAHWSCNGVQEHGGTTYNGSVYNTTSFAYTGGSFIPYQSLTQQDVLGWCWAAGVNKEATEAAVAGQIEAQKNPPVIQPPLPWLPAPAPAATTAAK